MSSTPRPSASRVASSLFNTGPNDLLAAVDVYTDKPTSVINSLIGKLSSFDTGILDNNSALGGIAGQLTSLFSGKSGAFSVNPSDMLNRVNSIVGGARGAISSLTGSVLSSLTSGIGLNSATAGRLAVTVGGVESRFNSADPTSVTNFMGVVNTLVSDTDLGSVLDVGAETSLLTGVVGQCIKLQIPNAISAIASNARSQSALKSALGSNVGLALDSGSVSAIQSILGVTGGQGIIRTAAPNATSRLLRNYSIPAGTPPSSYGALASTLTGVLSGIDTNWNSYSRGGTQISNLAAYTRASPDALKVLATDPSHRVAATMARDFKDVTSMRSTAKTLYPHMVFLS